MNKTPTIAIVGRPNVGKSSLFNRLCQKRVSIVADIEGVTRDFLIEEGSFFDKKFHLIDTGGIAGKEISFSKEIEEKVEKVIDFSDLVILVIDGQVGVQLGDISIAKKLLHKKKKIILAVNKMDRLGEDAEIYSSLGIKDKVAISCSHGHGIEELLNKACSYLPEKKETENPSSMEIAIVGKPNVGKSTLMNYLLKEKRSIESEIAGTTRDRISAPFDNLVLVDTAGIRKKKSEKNIMEKFAASCTKEAIDKSKICLVLLDSSEGFTAEDKKIVRLLEKEGKGIILLFNKWDKVKEVRMEHYAKEIKECNKVLSYYPMLFISAQTGRNVDKIKTLIDQVTKELDKKITTPELNDLIKKAMERYHPPMLFGKRLKVYYATQIASFPPRFSLFINQKRLVSKTYQKYLIHELRKAFGFFGAPVYLHLKDKKKA